MTAPDADARALHIRCGSDLRPTLLAAGFIGDYLEYSNPLCQGPVLPGDDWLEARAAFVARDYAPQADVLGGLRDAEAALYAAAGCYERVVMWFEHDSYDQLILARCLDAFAGAPPPVLELISVADYPVEGRFRGLGQLGSEAMQVLWPRRMLRAPDPTGLAALASSGIPDPPHLAGAVLRHCQELPWIGDGLA